MQQKTLTEQESILLIADMMSKVKNHFHESGANTILWGVVISVCGFTSFAQSYWQFSLGFDIWWLTVLAVAPQIWILIREKKTKVVKTYQESAIDIVWMVYIFTIVAMLVYANVILYTSPRLLASDHLSLFTKNTLTGEVKPFRMFAPSFSSIMLVLYAFPTLVTGLITKFRPFIVGAMVCYGLFIISLFTSYTYDMLFTGLAAIACWLIPGLILRSYYLKQKMGLNV